MKDTIAIALVLMYNLTILAGTVYMIEWHKWDPWWMLIALVCMMSVKKTKDEE